MLLWLKQWDSCVFGSHIRTTSDDVLSALRRHCSVVQHQKSYDHKKAFEKKPSLDNNIMKESRAEIDEDSSTVWNKYSKANHGSPGHKVGPLQIVTMSFNIHTTFSFVVKVCGLPK